eukprot:GHVL01006273.1.p1 GENE.GHVL01006273.1~~GHVL01006273.1.p1  ORF type:complete len:835 (-),score=219.42 GHVL01006273.1:1218-3722(-)
MWLARRLDAAVHNWGNENLAAAALADVAQNIEQNKPSIAECNEKQETKNLIKNNDNLIENSDNLIQNNDNLIENNDNLIQNNDNLNERVVDEKTDLCKKLNDWLKRRPSREALILRNIIIDDKPVKKKIYNKNTIDWFEKKDMSLKSSELLIIAKNEMELASDDLKRLTSDWPLQVESWVQEGVELVEGVSRLNEQAEWTWSEVLSFETSTQPLRSLKLDIIKLRDTTARLSFSKIFKKLFIITENIKNNIENDCLNNIIDIFPDILMLVGNSKNVICKRILYILYYIQNKYNLLFINILKLIKWPININNDNLNYSEDFIKYYIILFIIQSLIILNIMIINSENDILYLYNIIFDKSKKSIKNIYLLCKKIRKISKTDLSLVEWDILPVPLGINVFELLAESIISNFRYHFCRSESNTCRIDKPEWALEYMSKMLRINENALEKIFFLYNENNKNNDNKNSYIYEYGELYSHIPVGSMLAAQLAQEIRRFIVARMSILIQDESLFSHTIFHLLETRNETWDSETAQLLLADFELNTTIIIEDTKPDIYKSLFDDLESPKTLEVGMLDYWIKVDRNLILKIFTSDDNRSWAKSLEHPLGWKGGSCCEFASICIDLLKVSSKRSGSLVFASSHKAFAQGVYIPALDAIYNSIRDRWNAMGEILESIPQALSYLETAEVIFTALSNPSSYDFPFMLYISEKINKINSLCLKIQSIVIDDVKALVSRQERLIEYETGVFSSTEKVLSMIATSVTSYVWTKHFCSVANTISHLLWEALLKRQTFFTQCEIETTVNNYDELIRALERIWKWPPDTAPIPLKKIKVSIFFCFCFLICRML